MHPKVRELDSLLRRLERPGSRHARPRIATGCGPLDLALPGHGFLRGSLVEWLGDGPGCGAGMLALRAAREACREGGALVVIDPQRHFYPPAAAAWGVDLQNTIVVRATQRKQGQWALDQALRCPHVAAVVAWPQQLDGRAFRRLQLAVETSGCLGLLVRPAAAQRESSWADVRLLISPVGHALASDKRNNTAHQEPPALNWRLKIELLRCRGGLTQRTVDLEIDERTGDIHAAHPGNLATQLADSTIDSRQARA
jgi:protein ImuA